MHSGGEVLHGGHVAALQQGAAGAADAVGHKVAQRPVLVQVGGHKVEPRVVVAAAGRQWGEGARGQRLAACARQADGLDVRRLELRQHQPAIQNVHHEGAAGSVSLGRVALQDDVGHCRQSA